VPYIKLLASDKCIGCVAERYRVLKRRFWGLFLQACYAVQYFLLIYISVVTEVCVGLGKEENSR